MESIVYYNWLLSILKILGALLLVLLNGFFVAAEFAFVKVRPTRIAQLVEEGHRKARGAQECIEHIDAYLSVSQLGITLSSLGLGWLGEPAVASLLTPLLTAWGVGSPALVTSISFVVAFSLITFLHVVFGELAPKSLAIQTAENMALSLAGPMRFFYRIFFPAVAVLNGTANWFIKLLGFDVVNDTEMTHSEEELRMIIAESYRGGKINKTEQELLQNVFSFEERVAEEIMVPRPEVVFLNTHQDLDINLDLARESGHTRFPLIDGSPDRVIGQVNVKDLFYRQERLENLAEIRREVLYVPEGLPLDRLLTLFQKSRQHLAVVLDEYGGTAGIVSLEDVLEELVGEIQDEYDHEEPLILPEEDGTLLVSGRLFIDDAEELLGLKVDEDEPYNTLAGYMLGLLGKRPRQGDVVSQGPLKLEIVKMDGMRIDQVRVHNPRSSND